MQKKVQNPTLEKLAGVISLVISPLFLMPLLLIMVFRRGRMFGYFPSLAIVLILITGLICGVSVWVIFKKTRLISTWSIDDRRQRHLFNLSIFIIFILVIFLINLVGSEIIVRYLLLLMFGFLLFAFVTLFWKISAHSANVTLFALSAIHYYGIKAWWTLVFIPMVLWARVYQKNHTLTQTIAGVILSTVIFLIGYRLKLI